MNLRSSLGSIQEKLGEVGGGEYDPNAIHAYRKY